jgi:transposase
MEASRMAKMSVAAPSTWCAGMAGSRRRMPKFLAARYGPSGDGCGVTSGRRIAAPEDRQGPRRDTEARRRHKPRLLKRSAKGPEATGFAGQLWTCPRIAELIRRAFGVSCHVRDLPALLKALDWSVQKPKRQALERKADAIDAWVANDWPRVKNQSRRLGATLVFFVETGFPSPQTTAVKRAESGWRCPARLPTSSRGPSEMTCRYPDEELYLTVVRSMLGRNLAREALLRWKSHACLGRFAASCRGGS